MIAFARHHRAVIVEDDYDGELRHDDDPIDALRSSDAAEVVFYVGNTPGGARSLPCASYVGIKVQQCLRIIFHHRFWRRLSESKGRFATCIPNRAVRCEPSFEHAQ
jgi:hypothetical protein